MPPAHRQHQQSGSPPRSADAADSADALVQRFKAGLQQTSYYSVGRLWDDYAPAYRFGQRSQRRHAGLRFEDVERQLEREWDAVRGASRLGWVEARGAVEDAWSRNELQTARGRAPSPD